MSRYNRWRRKTRRKKIAPIIHRLTRRTSSEAIRNRAIDLLDDYHDFQARITSDRPPVEEEFLKITYQLLHLISDEEALETRGEKKFRAQKMAYYEEKLWDLYSELGDLIERLQYLNEHGARVRDRRTLKKDIRIIRKKIRKLKKSYRRVRRTGFLGLFKRKTDHSDDFILDRSPKEDSPETD